MLAGLVVGVLTLGLAGCVAPMTQTTKDEKTPQADEPTDSGTSLPTGDPATDPSAAGFEEFYGQEVDWSGCGPYECATMKAPLDWDDVSAGSIDLAVNRSLATGSADQRHGSLLINPGGPGASGLGFLDSAVNGMFGADVLDAYDVVAFDPRGVGASSAVDCGDDTTIDAYLTADFPMDDQADVDAARAASHAFGEQCLAATGPLLGEVDTVSSARDMDLIRAVVGDSVLNYAGFSYGTFLGATYAGLYPQNVGRMLLDGALDPSMSSDDLVVGQAIGFEAALRAYVEDCQSVSTCPLTGSVDDGMQQIADLVERIGKKPLDAGDGHVVNGTLAFYGIVVTLYDNQSWQYLTIALDEALRNNTGSTLLELANFYLDRTPDGEYTTNAMVAFTAINCLDYPTPVREYDEMLAFAEEVQEKAPTFGRDFVMSIGCEAWPFQSTVERAPITAPGAAPILVVGTTGDPATPYEWSVALADQLESGHLLTFEGEGHTAYGRSNSCIEDAVDAYLISGTLPADGLVC
jgi:pimeloyl-ACP methyl ester carboxylesterase